MTIRNTVGCLLTAAIAVALAWGPAGTANGTPGDGPLYQNCVNTQMKPVGGTIVDVMQDCCRQYSGKLDPATENCVFPDGTSAYAHPNR
ncbi:MULTISPECIES: hypothetical protein [unclassified Mycobacterium]|uniref:hypothetical protein n=1 Tax=unclassified Mycobacterium TaxID=2642494 RepID=UPI0012E7D949|nr:MULTISPECIES: hypothetical protein [unclassified Mycobacterium]